MGSTRDRWPRACTTPVAMEILAAISDTPFSTWIRESGSLFGYPMFILLHMIGLAIVVGLSSIVALLMLSGAPRSVRAATRGMFPVMWTGFGINFASGLALMAADAPTLAMNPVMWVKFGFIVAVVVLMRSARRSITADTDVAAAPSGRAGKALAAATLACWLGAIVTGRLTAYIGGPDFFVE